MKPTWKRHRLRKLHAPAGMILPVTSGDYAIPVTNGSGAVGKALDIRPPAQPLALVSGAYPVHGRYRFIAGGKWSWQYSVAAGG